MNSDNMLPGLFSAFMTGMWEVGPLVIAVPSGLYFALKQPTAWRFFLTASIAYLVYFVLLLAMPFRGFVTEVVIFLAAGGALVLPMSLFWRVAGRGKKSVLHQALFGFLALALFAAAMSTHLDRINYAGWLNWSCNGPIVERGRAAGNHNLPTLVVEAGKGRTRFVNVDEQLWNVAQPGQHLAKDSGSPMALLDGRRLRMVPRQLRWWNEPP